MLLASHRAIAYVLAAALGVLALASGPVAADEPTPTSTPITEGALVWGFKTSFRNYLGSSGLTDVSGGATVADGLVTFPVASGSYDPATGATEVDLAGTVRYRKYPFVGSTPPPGYDGPGEGHILDLTMAEPHLTISDGVQELTFDVQSRNISTWEMVDYGRITVVRLDITGVTPTVADGTTTWDDIPTTITELAANEVLFRQYRPGSALDALDLTYEGPGGVPNLTETWDEPGSTALADPETGLYLAPDGNINTSTWIVDSARQLAHYTTTVSTDAGFQRALHAFDLKTLTTIGEPLTFPLNAFVPNADIVDTTNGRVLYASSGGAVDSFIRWDAATQRYVQGTLAGSIPRAGVWDPVGERVVSLQRVVPPDVSSSAYDQHEWRLSTSTERPDGTWATVTRTLPNGPTGFNQNWYRTAQGASSLWAFASDGSLITVRGTVNARPPATTPPETVPLQRIVIGPDTATVTEIPGTETPNNPSGRWGAVVAGPDGQVTAVRGYHTSSGAPALVQELRVASSGSVTVEHPPVELGDMQAAADKVVVDQSDGTIWAVGSRTKDLAAVRDGRLIFHRFFAALHTDRPEIAVGPDHEVYAQTLVDEDVTTFGFGRFDRLGFSPEVTTQPESEAVTLGVGEASAPVSFTVAGEGTPAPTVQWQSAPAGTSRFADVDGATEPTLQLDATSGDDGRRVRAVVANAAGRTVSEEASLSVRAAPSVVTQPTDVTAIEGDDAVLQVIADGNPVPAVQWQRYSQGFWIDVEDGEDSILTIPATNVDMTGARFRARLRNEVATVHSRTVTLTVDERSDEVSTVVGGELDWGVRQSFRTYIAGQIAHGDITTSEGATIDDDETFLFPAETGSVAVDRADADFGGVVRFTGHEGFGTPPGVPALDLTIGDIRLDLDLDADEGTLVADVASRGLEDGEVATYDDVTFAALDLAGVDREQVEGGIRLSDVPATLTEDGSAAFADFYEPGDDLDPLTVTLLLDDGEHVRTAVESFVTAALTDFLGVAPSDDAVAAGVAVLGQGTKAAFLHELVSSDAWLEAIVDRFYQDTLGRPADPAGAAFWIGRLRAGWSVARVAASFYSSGEYYRGAGGGTDGSWIDDLYASLLGRPSDPAGRAYWIGEITGTSRGDVALRFHQSAESARTRVRALYQQLLGRAADPSGLAFWAPRVIGQGDLVLAVQLAASGEYQARAVQRFP